MPKKHPDVRISWDEAQAVYALMHDWHFEFIEGRCILTDKQAKTCRQLYDYIEELRYERGED